MRLLLSLLLGAVLLTLQSGCSQSDADMADTKSADADHHLEHFVPHHKPANFANAVKQISQRVRHLSEHAGHGHSHEIEEFQELVEIVDWIPELAADSDLNQSEWNQARDAANKLAVQLAAARSSEGELNLNQLSDATADGLGILEGLISAAGKPEPRIGHNHNHNHNHDHDHDHDHNHDHNHDHDHDHDGEHELDNEDGD